MLTWTNPCYTDINVATSHQMNQSYQWIAKKYHVLTNSWPQTVFSSLLISPPLIIYSCISILYINPHIQAWAVYKGKFREGRDKADPTMWKTRLRCALNKSTDFQEVPERNQLDITEPYKVYHIQHDNGTARPAGENKENWSFPSVSSYWLSLSCWAAASSLCSSKEWNAVSTQCKGFKVFDLIVILLSTLQQNKKNSIWVFYLLSFLFPLAALLRVFTDKGSSDHPGQ